MKPFSLEAAKRGEPIVTRDGREAKFIAHVEEAKKPYRVVAMIHGDVKMFHECGSFFQNKTTLSDLDLFMAPKKRTVWVNLYSDGQYELRETEKDAESNAFVRFGRRIGGKAYPVEIEE